MFSEALPAPSAQADGRLGVEPVASSAEAQRGLRGVAHGDAGAHGAAVAYVSSRGGPHDDAHGDGHGDSGA